MSIATTEMLCEVDMLRQDVTVYRHVDQESLGQHHGYRADTLIDIPYVKAAGEPLALQLQHFLDLVTGQVCAAKERAQIAGAHVLMAEVLDQLGVPMSVPACAS